MAALNDEVLNLKKELSNYKFVQKDLKDEIAHLRHHIDNTKVFAVYQLVVDHTNESFRVSFVNPSFKDIAGVEDPMDHGNWMAVAHPDELDRLAMAHEKAFKETHRFEEVVKMFHSEKKEWRWLQFLATATTDHDGKPKWVDGIVFDVTEQKRTELKMLEYQKRLQDLSQRQFADEERERRRIAEILHDVVGQDLSLALFKINQAKEWQTGLGPLLNEVAPLLEQAMSYTRSLTKKLCPPELYQMGLKSGLEWLGARFEEQHKVFTELEVSGDIHDIGEELETVIFRTMAELMNNVAKHANASHAVVRVEIIPKTIVMAVADDGIGFNYSPEILHKKDSFGLFMISERLRNIGGNIDIYSEPGAGTRVKVEIPNLTNR